MTSTFYIFYGEERLSLEEQFKTLLASFDDPDHLNTNYLDGHSTRTSEILNSVSSLPFLATLRIVIVKDFLSRLSGKSAGNKQEQDLLLEGLANLPAFARLIFLESNLDPKNNFLKSAAKFKHGEIRSFTAPDDISSWITHRCKNYYQSEIEPQAAFELGKLVGPDLLRADNELFKLIAYVDGKRAIQIRDIAELTPYIEEANIFETIDAIAVGNGKRALELVHRSFEQNPREQGFGIFSRIVSQFRNLLLVKEQLATNPREDNKTIATLLKIHPYPAKKLMTQSAKFKLEDLEKIYKHLQQLDVDMKTGRIEPRLGIDLFIIAIANKTPYR
ncbi:DNA polymerase III subunit delta [Anaerolineales bacterium]